VATSLSAQKLVLYGQEKGVLNSKGHYINRLQPEKAQGLLPYQTEEGKRLLRAAIQACYNGVERSQIISYSEDGSLLVELFTRDGSGTLVYQDHYEEIRSARIDDISGIIELIRPLEEQGVLRRRSRKELEAEIHLFSVVLLDGMIIGCAALHPVPVGDPKTCFAELACVVVHPNYRQGHRGEHLLQHAEQQAKTQNIKTLFVMTTQTSHWFQERGFEVSSEESLPEDIRKKYDPKRASKVLTKQL